MPGGQLVYIIYPWPDGYMNMPELVSYMTDYASRISAPVYKGVTVTAVRPSDQGYRVMTEKYCILRVVGIIGTSKLVDLTVILNLSTSLI